MSGCPPCVPDDEDEEDAESFLFDLNEDRATREQHDAEPHTHEPEVTVTSPSPTITTKE